MKSPPSWTQTWSLIGDRIPITLKKPRIYWVDRLAGVTNNNVPSPILCESIHFMFCVIWRKLLTKRKFLHFTSMSRDITRFLTHKLPCLCIYLPADQYQRVWAFRYSVVLKTPMVLEAMFWWTFVKGYDLVVVWISVVILFPRSLDRPSVDWIQSHSVYHWTQCIIL